ncbi:MAG: protein kinase [Planctomycetes bacterium]|nr:protein kinase [Planctomycetota bacterium]
MPLKTRVDAAYADWFERYREGDETSVGEFLTLYPPEVRSELEERIREHLRLAQIFEKRDQRITAGVLVDGEFELLRELGVGSTSVVWEARQRSLDRRVAIKFLQLSLALLSDQARERFDREGRIMGGIRHPGLVAVFARGIYRDIPYLAVEYIEGSCPLDVLLKNQEELAEGGGSKPDQQHDRKVAAWFLDISQAMAEVHREGIYHRDIKPANILIGGDGRARLIDFGLGQMDDQLDISQDGALLGTPMYMSPEQFSGQTDAQSDMYSLGVTLYETLTLQRPFFADSIDLVRKKVEGDDIPDPRSVRALVPLDLATIVRKMTEKSPAHRYKDMQAVSADLDAFLAGESIEAMPPTRAQQSWRWLRRRPQLLLGVGVGMVIALLLVGLGIALSAQNRALDKELQLERLLQDYEVQASVIELDLEAPAGEPLYQLNELGQSLEKLSRGSGAPLEQRVQGYKILIEGYIEYYLHENAEVLLDEVSKLLEDTGQPEMTDLYLREFPVYYRSLIELEKGEFLKALRGFWGWQTNYEERVTLLQQASKDLSAPARDRREAQGFLKDLRERRDNVFTDLLIAALRSGLERDLVKFRRRFGLEPVDWLMEQAERLSETLPASDPRLMRCKLARGLFLVHHLQWSEALELFSSQHELARTSSLMGENHPLTRELQLEKARMMVRAGDFQKANAEMREVLAWWERMTNLKPGEYGVNTLIPEWRIGWAFLEYYFTVDGELEPKLKDQLAKRSFKMYSGAVMRMREAYPENNLNTLQAETGFAVLLYRMGRHQEALELARGTLERKRATLGRLNHSTLISLRCVCEVQRDYVGVLLERGELEEADMLIREVALEQLGAVESQFERVAAQHLPKAKDGAAFQPQADLDLGYMDYEAASEIRMLGGWLHDHPEAYETPEILARFRVVAREFVPMLGNPYYRHDQSLKVTKATMAEFFRDYDPTDEGQELSRVLFAASK